MYPRMTDKLSKGSNFDIGVIGMQGKAAETRKLQFKAYWQQKIF